jgi:hypothetical protein
MRVSIAFMSNDAWQTQTFPTINRVFLLLSLLLNSERNRLWLIQNFTARGVIATGDFEYDHPERGFH